MARMMGRMAWSRKCACFDCHESPDMRGTVRNREKHVIQQWLDEYESRAPVSCPWCEGSDDPRFHYCHEDLT